MLRRGYIGAETNMKAKEIDTLRHKLEVLEENYHIATDKQLDRFYAYVIQAEAILNHLALENEQRIEANRTKLVRHE